jgi:hypothetical protein
MVLDASTVVTPPTPTRDETPIPPWGMLPRRVGRNTISWPSNCSLVYSSIGSVSRMARSFWVGFHFLGIDAFPAVGDRTVGISRAISCGQNLHGFKTLQPRFQHPHLPRTLGLHPCIRHIRPSPTRLPALPSIALWVCHSNGSLLGVTRLKSAMAFEGERLVTPI